MILKISAPIGHVHVKLKSCVGSIYMLNPPVICISTRSGSAGVASTGSVLLLVPCIPDNATYPHGSVLLSVLGMPVNCKYSVVSVLLSVSGTPLIVNVS